MTERAPDLDDTIPSRARASVPARFAEVDSDTILRLIEPVTPSEQALDTRATDALLAAAVRSSAVQPQAEPASPGWALRVRGTTVVVPLDIPVIIGRRPLASRVPEATPPRRLVIPATFVEVSARHVRVEQLGESLVVHDLGSTNGTVVHWATGAVRRLRRGESCAVLPDAVIVVADGVVIEFIDRPAH